MPRPSSPAHTHDAAPTAARRAASRCPSRAVMHARSAPPPRAAHRIMYSFTSRTNRLTHGAAFQLALLSNTCAHRAIRRVGLERARARVVCGVRGAAATSHGAVAPAASWCPCPTIVRSPGADVAGASPVLVQMWQASAKPRCRCGRREPSPSEDVGRLSFQRGSAPLHVRRLRASTQLERRSCALSARSGHRAVPQNAPRALTPSGHATRRPEGLGLQSHAGGRAGGRAGDQASRRSAQQCVGYATHGPLRTHHTTRPGAAARGGERNVHVAIVSTYLVADDKGERVRVLDERIDDQLHRPSALVRPVGPTRFTAAPTIANSSAHHTACLRTAALRCAVDRRA